MRLTVRRRICERSKDESGQTLVLVAVGLALFFGMALLVIDASRLFVQKRSDQNAADAVALAIARDIDPSAAPNPTCTLNAGCQSDGSTYLTKNGIDPAGLTGGSQNGWHACLTPALDPTFSDTNCFAYPYYKKSAPSTPIYSQVEVRLTNHTTGNFTKVVGVMDVWNTSARAVAAAQTTSVDHCSLGDQYLPTCVIPGPGVYAYAASQACGAITITGSGHDFRDGALWSNGGITANNINYADFYRFGQTAHCADGTKFTDCGAAGPPCSVPPGTHVSPTYTTTLAAGVWPSPLPDAPNICPGGTYASGSPNIDSTWLASHRGDFSGSDMSVTNGSKTATSASGGGGGGFVANDVGRAITIGGVQYRIAAVTNSATIQLNVNYAGSTAANVSFSSAGVYCFTGTVAFQANFSGYGFVSSVSGGSQAIKCTTDGLTVTGSALAGNLLAYAVNSTAGNAISMNPGNGINLNGNMYAPNGGLTITGKNNVNTGLGEAQTIVINNSGTTWHGSADIGAQTGTITHTPATGAVNLSE
jgi:hypothetical protein